MDIIVEIQFGSHLYGTSTPRSDIDIKSVFIPKSGDILLQRVKGVVSINSRKKVFGEKNTPEDIDREMFSLQRFLQLLAEGQSMALDMLFAPDTMMIRPPAPLWREIQANAPRLVSRRSCAFVHYCRQQANKYGIKGSRVASARQALSVLTIAEATLGGPTKLAKAKDFLTELTDGSEFIQVTDLSRPDGQSLRVLEVCGKKMPFPNSIKSAREIVQRLVNDYGHRALQAERNEGVDWKALSHAVRVGREALELLRTGRITLPLPYADEILSIKLGERSYQAVAEVIDQLLTEIEAATLSSSLPEEADQAFIDELVERAYREKVTRTP